MDEKVISPLPKKAVSAGRVLTVLLCLAWFIIFICNFFIVYRHVALRALDTLKPLFGLENQSPSLGNLDFHQYLAASRRMRAEPAVLYGNFDSRSTEREFQADASSTYPPTFYFMMLPLTYLPQPISEGIWMLIKLASVLLLCILMPIISFKPKEDKTGALKKAPLFFLLMLSAAFTYEELIFGQINIILLLMLTVSIFFLDKGRPGLAGVLAGMVFCIKLISLPILLYFAFSRNFKALISAVIVVGFVIILTLSFFGPQVFIDYSRAFPVTSSIWLNSQNQSPAALFNARSFSLKNGLQKLNLWYYIYAGLMTLFCTFIASASNNGKTGEVFSFLIISIFLVSPVVWPSQHVWLMLPLWIYAGKLIESVRKSSFNISAFLFLVLMAVMACLDGTGGAGPLADAGRAFVCSRGPLLITVLLWIISFKDLLKKTVL